MRRIVLVLLLFLGLNIEIRCDASEYPIVTTALGRIKGSTVKSRLGKTIYSFRGIRYAKPPVGNLRFMPPQPVDKWEGVYDATKDGSLCLQPRMFGNSSEDCLILNIYTTKLPTSENACKRPVIVHIHAGGYFIGGSISTQMGPNYFLDQDIVLVTFNYRLASMGFLSTGDEHAPGNNGLRDQVELLKWVKHNIEPFCGDPNSVTLLGYSVGGWSALLHMVSSLSQGLFHKAVSMSGSPIGIWPIKTNLLEAAKKQARLVGCPDDTSEKIVKCLKKVPAEQLAESLLGFLEFGTNPMMIWGPVIEGDFGKQKFLTEHPIRLITEGNFMKVPYIAGQTKDEVGFKAFEIVDNATLTQELNDNFENVAPIIFTYERNSRQSRNVTKAIKRFYFHDRPVDKSQVNNLAEAFTDTLVTFQVNRGAKLVARYGDKPVYYYCFNFQGRYSYFYLPGTNNTIPWGVVHGDDLSYLFYDSINFPLFKKNSPKPEVDMIDKLTTIFANFARTGNPIPHVNEKLDEVKWERFTLESQKYLDIGNKLTIKEKLYEKRIEFWENLYPLRLYTGHK
ncbi:juvenile hormone esterase isoform X2 [Leptinotarsa decemlineata]|uniref:juvenile hormone esterase isoform X2 n=1 Tax=Leptinotarsa decemlineata TaxID=7539 RepID=UPI003D305087